MDSDSANWSTASTAAIAVSNEANIKTEGPGSLKMQTGAPKIDANTVALWRFEETSGTGAYIKDATANANNATPTGTTVVDGIFGKARSFNGTSDYVNIGSSAMSGTNNFTIECLDLWILYTTVAERRYLSGSVYNGDQVTGNDANWGFQVRTSGHLNAVIIWSQRISPPIDPPGKYLGIILL